MRTVATVLTTLGVAALVGMFATPPPAHADQTPFLGTPVLGPGLLEVENFDNGGQDVAYYDSTPENEGGAPYRPEAVDIESTFDTGGGFDVGWVTAGEWLEYSISIPPSRYVQGMHIRYASLGFGGYMHVEANGTDITGPIALPDTGGWQTWSTIGVNTTRLIGGNYILRLVFDSAGPDGWLPNFNYIWLNKVETPWNDEIAPPLLPHAHVEAEHYDQGGEGVAYHDSTQQNEGGAVGFNDDAVDVEVTQDAGGGYDVGWITPGEWMNYWVDALNGTPPGLYTFSIRYAALGDGGTMHIEMNGVDVTGPIHLPDTGGWQTWSTVTIPNVFIDATVGHWIMRLSFDEGSADGWLANINYVNIDAQ